MHRISTSIATIGLVSSFNTFALGIGNITTSSNLNQVLNAHIPLHSSSSEDPSNLRIKLATPVVFKNAGIERSNYLLGLKFEPVINKNGDISITVSSTSPIKEPFVNFILDVEWPQGRTLKEFTILLDPPVYINSTKPTIEALATPQPPANTVTNKLSEVSIGAESTFVSPQSNNSKLTNIGPIKAGATLWDIAKGLTADNPNSSHHQLMMALFEKNPEAFYKNNVNALKRGAILRAPSSAEINQKTAKTSRLEFRKHYQEWSSPSAKTPRLNANSSVKKATEIAPKEATTSNTASDSKLTLVSADDIAEQAAAANSTADSKKSTTKPAPQNKLALEMVVTLERENEETKSRLQDIEEQVQKLQRLLTLKDEQLAQLQAINNKLATTKPAPSQTDKPETNNSIVISNNSLLYSGGGIAFLILLSLLVAKRKKENKKTERSLDSLVTSESDEPTPDLATPTPLQEENIEVEAPSIPSDEPVSKQAASSPSSADSDSDGASALTECDVYIAYGRFEQAEEIIQAAIDNAPQNLLYKQKLLDVYYASSNIEGFESLANELIDLTETDPEAWEKIAQMGSELLPHSELFSTTDSADSADSTDEMQDDLEFDFDLISPEKSAIETASEKTLADDKTADTTSQDEVQQELTNNSSHEVEDANSSIDFELTEEQPTDSDQANTEHNSDLDIHFDLELDSDEADSNEESRLSLAEAYIDMEDFKSAEEVLSDILKTSESQSHIEKAQTMLDSFK